MKKKTPGKMVQRWKCQQVIDKGLPSVMEGMRRSEAIWEASGRTKSPLQCDAEAAEDMLKASDTQAI